MLKLGEPNHYHRPYKCYTEGARLQRRAGGADVLTSDPAQNPEGCNKRGGRRAVRTESCV